MAKDIGRAQQLIQYNWYFWYTLVSIISENFASFTSQTLLKFVFINISYKFIVDCTSWSRDFLLINSSSSELISCFTCHLEHFHLSSHPAPQFQLHGSPPTTPRIRCWAPSTTCRGTRKYLRKSDVKSIWRQIFLQCLIYFLSDSAPNAVARTTIPPQSWLANTATNCNVKWSHASHKGSETFAIRLTLFLQQSGQ